MPTMYSTKAWSRIRKAIPATVGKRLVAVSYVTQDHLGLLEGDCVIVDASHAAIATGETSALLLKRWHDTGIRIKSNPRLHAKMVIGPGYTCMGSGNLSKSSENDLHECVLLSEDPEIHKEAMRIWRFFDRRSIDLCAADITRLLNIPVIRRTTRRYSHSVGRKDPNIWVCNVFRSKTVKAATRAAIDSSEARAKAAGISVDDTSEFVLSSRDRVARSIKARDILVFISSKNETYIKTADSAWVMQPVSVLHVDKTSDPIVIRYMDHGWETAVSFKDCQKTISSVGGRLCVQSHRQLKPDEFHEIQRLFFP